MTLTEQLKKGELEQGYYYMQIPTGDIRIITECMKVDCKGFSILSKVPSYEEWQELHKRLKDTQNLELKVRKENQQLKELLEECYPYVRNEVMMCEVIEQKDLADFHKKLLTKIDNAIGEKK